MTPGRLCILFILLAGTVFAGPTDSLRVEVRNGRKYIIHRVVKGEKLPDLAAYYGVAESDITSANAMISVGVYPGQVIKVPLNEAKYGDAPAQNIVPISDSRMPLATTLAPPAPSKYSNPNAQPTTPQVEDTTPVVIATPESRNEQIVVKDSMMPKVAEQPPVQPPPPAVPPVQVQNPAAPQTPVKRTWSKYQVYVCASSQTVQHLANAWEVDVEDIIELNKLKYFKLSEGQKVKIPIYDPLPEGAIAATPQPVPEPVKEEPPKPVEPPPVVKQEPPKPVEPPVIAKQEPPKPIEQPPAQEPPKPVVTPPVVKKQPPKPLLVPPVKREEPVVKTETPAEQIPVPPPVNNKPSGINPVKPKGKGPAIAGRTPGKPKPVKTVTIPELEEGFMPLAVDSGYMLDTTYRAGKSLALLRGYSDAQIDKLDSAYIHPDNVIYKVNDFRNDDYYYDIWAIKAANANALHVNTTNQRAGYGDKTYVHTVKAGETIQSIAKKYKISVTDLINWNGLYKYEVRVGQDLTVNAARADLAEFEMAHLDVKERPETARVKEEVHVGLAYFNPKSPQRGVYCNNVPKGKIIYILNRENFMEYYGRVIGPLPKNVPSGTIIQVDREVAEVMHINNPLINIEIWYGIIE